MKHVNFLLLFLLTGLLMACVTVDSEKTANYLSTLLPQPNEIPKPWSRKYESGADELRVRIGDFEHLEGLERKAWVAYDDGLPEYNAYAVDAQAYLFRDADSASKGFSFLAIDECSRGFGAKTRQFFPINNLGDEAIGFRCGSRPGGPGSDSKFLIYVWRSKKLLLRLLVLAPPSETIEKEIRGLADKMQSRVR